MKTQMPFNNEIEKTKKEIEILTAKLALLKELEKTKTPVEECYKDWWGQYPETGTWDSFDDTRWQGFQAGFQSAQSKNTEPYCPDEPDWYDEVEWDEKDNLNLQKVIDEMVEERKSQKLWNILRNKHAFFPEQCDEIVDLVEEWLPKEQSAAGSQNVNTELLVEGFNDAIRKMKEMLR